MAARFPDWQQLMARAQALHLEDGPSADGDAGYVYLVADSHLGDARAPVEGFVEMLHGLERPRLVVLLGDLFKVWLALPRFWDVRARRVLEGLHALRGRGVPVWLVVGNREFFLPATGAEAVARGLPFDAVVPDAAVLHWAGRRYGLTHGDLVNRRDRQYLRWRRLARSRPFAWLFRAMPGPLARRVAESLERTLASTNQEIKIAYPADELAAFTAAVLPGLDGFFIGHFHRDETLRLPGDGGQAGAPVLRIVPDWFSSRQVLRLHADGRTELLDFTGPRDDPPPGA